MKRVIVVDADPVSRGLVAACAEELGLVVEPFADGPDAMRRARQAPPDILVCARAGDGAEVVGLLAEVRAEPDLAPCQFVVVAESNEPGAHRRAMDLGFDDLLAKPLDAGAVRACLRARARRRDADLAEAGERVRRLLDHPLPPACRDAVDRLREDVDRLRRRRAESPAFDVRPGIAGIRREARQVHQRIRHFLVDLELATSEPSAADGLQSPDDAAECVRRASETALSYLEKDLDLDLRTAPVPVPLPERLLATLVEELVDFAGRARPAGSRLRVALRGDAGRAVLEVDPLPPAGGPAPALDLAARIARRAGAEFAAEAAGPARVTFARAAAAG